MNQNFIFTWKKRTGFDNAVGMDKMPLIELWCGKQCLAQIMPNICESKRAGAKYELVWCLFSPNTPTCKSTPKKFENFRDRLFSFNIETFKREIEAYVCYELDKLETK